MRKSNLLILFLWVLSSCSAAIIKEQKEWVFFPNRSQEIWTALKELIFVEMGCIPKKIDKKKKKIETTWTTIISPEETLRWRIVARIKPAQGGTLVKIKTEVYKLREEKEDVYLTDRRAREDSRKGWIPVKRIIPGTENLYERLKRKLSTQ